MNIYKIGLLVGYLRSMEIPEWVENLCDEFDKPHMIRSSKKKVAIQNNDVGEDETTEVEESDEDYDVSTPVSTRDRFNKMYAQGMSTSDIADNLGLAVTTIYAMRSARKKELEG